MDLAGGAAVRAPELGGLLDSLRPATASLASAASASLGFLTQTNLTSRCFDEVILPAGDTVINEGPFTTGASAFKEFWYVMTAFASEAQGFDGNGSLREHGDRRRRHPDQDRQALGPAEEPRRRSTGRGLTRRSAPGRTARRKKPKYKPDKDCYKNAKPNLNGPAATPGPPDQALRARRGQ